MELQTIEGTGIEKAEKAEIVEFLTTVMRGKIPIYDESLLDPDQFVYDFIQGKMVPKPQIPEMKDRIKACDSLIKLHGLAIEKTENTFKLAKDEHFKELDSFFDVVNSNKNKAETED